MKTFTIVNALFLLLIISENTKADTRQEAAYKKLASYGCKLIQSAQGKSEYKCKSNAPKSLIKYYTKIIKK